MSTARRYTRQMYDRYKYLATWLPNTRIELGDVGTIDGDTFKRVTTLKDLQVQFDIRRGTDELDFSETSSSGVECSVGASSGTTPGTAEGSLAVKFAEEGAFVFRATGCRTHEIADKVSLGREVLSQCKAGLWDPKWRIVDTVVRAECSTIIVSRSKSASLSLGGGIPLLLANIATPEAKVAILGQSGDVLHMLATEGLTPLFTLIGVKQSWLSRLLGASPIFGGPGSDPPIDDVTDEDAFERESPPTED